MKVSNNLQMPNHLAIIPDGNRRWARAHGMQPWMGHRYGAQKFEKVFEWCLELNVPQLSVWAGSTENLIRRSPKEVKELLKVYYDFCKIWESKQPLLDKYEVRVRFIGNLDKLPKKLLKIMGRLMQRTANHQKKVLNIMVNYGGETEMLDVVKRIAIKMVKLGRVQVSKKDIEKNLWVAEPVDLIIRTGGTHRLSNFLMWQSAYAEMYVTNTLWPSFSKRELVKAIKWYNKTQRNFGR
jgi:tritrans,polycis-undecaprenyl-diphosphate synthase [geranylgeranyl-diphosphate specific]